MAWVSTVMADVTSFWEAPESISCCSVVAAFTIALYWALHPERQPSCVYIPFFEAYEHPDASDFSAEDFLAQIRESFDPLCDYTAEKGQGGYILYVTGWHLKPAASPNR